MFDTEDRAAAGSGSGYVCDVVDDLAGAYADVPPEDVFESDGVWNPDVIPGRHVRRLSAVEILDFVFDDAVSHQTVVNRESARQMFAVHEAFQIAREYVRVYVPVGVADTSVGVDDVDFSERAVAFDLAHRLHVSENLVRAYDHQAGVLTGSLSRLCELFLAGRISSQHVRAAVDSADGIPTETLMATYDQRLALIAEGLRVGEFARRCRLLRERLCADTLQERHDREVEKRRVSIEPVEDGMGWLNLYAPIVDLAVIDARLSGTATRIRQEPGETRTKEQLRADILIAWATGHSADRSSGDGSSGDTNEGSGSLRAAVSVQPVLVIDADGRFAELLGYGPIDPRSAAASLHNAPAFHRVINDPVAPANLNLDRRSYRPTAAQRRWLKIRYGLIDDAAPYLPPDAEIDHAIEYQHGGMTNVSNLLPMKKHLHRIKTITRIRIDPKPDGTIRIRTPTGYDTDPPPF